MGNYRKKYNFLIKRTFSDIFFNKRGRLDIYIKNALSKRPI